MKDDGELPRMVLWLILLVLLVGVPLVFQIIVSIGSLL